MAAFSGEPVAAWTRATDQWLQCWSDLNRRVIEANRGAAEALGVLGERDAPEGAALPSVAYRRSDWSFERSVDRAEDIGVGTTVSFSKSITDEDVRDFARASGDTNRLHLDEEFAARSRFGERIAHGTLVAGVISSALARLPGLTIYLSQDVQYLGPVPVGERVRASCEVVEDLGGDRYRLTTVVTDESDEMVIDGEAVVLIDDLPDAV